MHTVEGEPRLLFAIRAPLVRADLPGLSARVCTLLGAARAPVAICDCAEVAADAVAVDALARLQVAARRNHCRVHLRNASPELRELVAFMGLEDILPDAAELG
jgi:ABC-type transporter Mla MlaB component